MSLSKKKSTLSYPSPGWKKEEQLGQFWSFSSWLGCLWGNVQQKRSGPSAMIIVSTIVLVLYMVILVACLDAWSATNFAARMYMGKLVFCFGAGKWRIEDKNCFFLFWCWWQLRILVETMQAIRTSHHLRRVLILIKANKSMRKTSWKQLFNYQFNYENFVPVDSKFGI